MAQARKGTRPSGRKSRRPRKGTGARAPSGPDPAPPGSQPFPVVAIGASAGGLEAFQKFFSAMEALPGED